MSRKPLEVVVVDDETPIIELLQTFLRCISKDLHVHAFSDPEEARAHLLQHHVDVLITDFKMPKYDGIQLIQLMPEDSTKILISGFAPEITEERRRKLNATFLEKPVVMKDLRTLILRAEAHSTTPAA
jgi:DNA-binding NtrC family response regulator